MFDKKVRDSIAQATDVPGPGSYISQLDLDADIPQYQKIAIKKKYEETDKIVSPGPAFDVSGPARKLKLRSPSYRMGTGPKVADSPLLVNRRHPGPGQYDPFREGFGSALGRKRQHSFSRSIREMSRSVNITPGPGEYRIPAKFCEL